MARAMARAKGLEPDAEDDSSASESDENCAEAPPTEEEVKAAGRVILKWSRRPKARSKMLERIGQFDDSRLGSGKEALRIHLSGKMKALPLVIVPDVLPARVANAALVVLRSLPELAWQSATSHTDTGEKSHGAGSAGHSFSGCSRDDVPLLSPIFKVLERIMPKQVFLGQCSRYKAGDFIEPHDDSAYATVGNEQNSRDVAVILHLAPDWVKGHGGLFVDHAGKSVRTPVFNSMVAFRVPRQHEVTEVIGQAPRYSIYGWFVQPGRLYELDHGCSQGQNKKTKRARIA